MGSDEGGSGGLLIMRHQVGSWDSIRNHGASYVIMRHQVGSWDSRWDHGTAGGIMRQQVEDGGPSDIIGHQVCSGVVLPDP